MTDTQVEAEKPVTTEVAQPIETTEIKTDTQPVVTDEVKADTTVKTIIDEPVKEDVVTPKYPEDWREQFANGDEKKLERLKRFASPEALAESYIEIEKRLRSGQFPKGLTAESTPEEVAEYRKAYGVPETPDKYDLNLGDGYVIGDDIKPQVDVFLEKMHAKNTSPDVVKEALKTYFELQAAETAKYLETQEQFKEKTITELRQEWGASYDRNMNVLKNFVQSRFGEASGTIFGAVALDGTPLMNQPAIVRQFMQLAMDNDPVGTVMPSNNATGADLDTEIKNLRTLRTTNEKAYFKDPNNSRRLEELLAAKSRIK